MAEPTFNYHRNGKQGRVAKCSRLSESLKGRKQVKKSRSGGFVGEYGPLSVSSKIPRDEILGMNPDVNHERVVGLRVEWSRCRSQLNRLLALGQDPDEQDALRDRLEDLEMTILRLGGRIW